MQLIDADVASTGHAPTLQTDTVRLPTFHPETTPKSVEPVTRISEPACPVPVTVTWMLGKLGSFVVIVMTADRGPVPDGVNLIWNGKQKSWLTDTGKPAEGGITWNSGFEDVIDVTTRFPALVLQTFSVSTAEPPEHNAPNTGADGTWTSGIATFANVRRQAPRPRVPRYRLISPPGAS